METKYKGNDVVQLSIDTLMTIYIAGFNHGAREGQNVLPTHGTFDAFHRTINDESPMEDKTSYDIKDKIKLIKKRKKSKKSGPDLTIWRPITFEELEKMSIDEQKQLLSYCWLDNGNGVKPRCETIGITDLIIGRKQNDNICEISWSDRTGDPRIRDIFKNSDKIHKITDDGEWFYGLYIKI